MKKGCTGIMMMILTGFFPGIVWGAVLRVTCTDPSIRSFYIDDTAVIRQVPDHYATIQSAIDDASPGDTILISDGTYKGEGNKNIRYNGKAITVMSDNGMDHCFIDCEGVGRGFHFCGGETREAVLRGITILNGNIPDWETGGGIRFHNSSATVTDCMIQNCSANGTMGQGGGISGYGASPVIANCTIKNNSAWYTGGGIQFWIAPDLIISNCTIIGNTSQTGGGMSLGAFSATITNCLMADNQASGEGGGVNIANGVTTINGCTIIRNHSGNLGGGLLCTTSFPVIRNSIFWDNECPTGPELSIGAEGDYLSVGHILYSDVEGGMASVSVGAGSSLFWGDGMISADPLFVSGPHGDYYLSLIESGQSANSPCRNAGDGLAGSVCFQNGAGRVCMNQLTTRTDERTDINRVDMGYHYTSPSILPPESPGGIIPN